MSERERERERGGQKERVRENLSFQSFQDKSDVLNTGSKSKLDPVQQKVFM